MASFTVYDPRFKTFRPLETPSETDLTFEQVLLINILLELRTQTELIQLSESDPPTDDPDEIRAGLVQEIV